MPRDSPQRGGVEVFDEAIAPLSLDRFLSEYWTRNMLHQRGAAGRFVNLLSWTQLNHVLSNGIFTEGVVRLYKDGVAVPAAEYLLARRHGYVVDSHGLTRQIASGATLVVNRVDDLVPAVGGFCESLDMALGGGQRTQVNLYAGWHTARAFDLHWDAEEITILQVYGRKHWAVYKPTVDHPLVMGGETGEGFSPKRKVAESKPQGEPAWEGVIEDGDLLYLPRGWWHVARPLGEPCLHLTVGTIPARGQDLLAWLTAEVAEARMDVPFWGRPDEQREYLDRLAGAMTDAIRANPLDRYLAARTAQVAPRPRLTLPALPTSTPAIPVDSSVRLTAARRLSLDRQSADETLRFDGGGRQWSCPAGFASALRLLRDTPRPLAELTAVLADEETRRGFRMLLGALAMHGVVTATPIDEGSEKWR